MADEKKFLGIELLRFLCSFSVLVWHYAHFFFIAPDTLPEAFSKAQEPFYSALSVFHEYGDLAVQVFWTISGFIFFWKYANGIFQRRVSLKAFSILRFSRLYPLHLATLLLVLVLQTAYRNSFGRFFVYAENDVYHFVLNVLFVSSWGFEKGDSFNGPIWSVSAEIFTYGVFFLAARFLRLSLATTLALMAVSIVVLKANLLYQPLAECLMLFFWGGALFLSYEKVSAAKMSLQRALVAGTGAIVVLSLAVGTAAGPTSGGTPFHGPLLKAFVYFVFVPSAILSLTFLFNLPRLARWHASLSTLGNLTYSSYLLHFPIQLGAVLISDRLGLARALYENPAVFVTYIAVVYVLSHLTFLFYERTAQNKLRTMLIVKWSPAN